MDVGTNLMMRHYLYLLALLVMISCNGNSQTEESLAIPENQLMMTVILHDSLKPYSDWKSRVLLKDSLINPLSTSVDIYFSNRIAHLPYYLPTNGVYMDSVKEKECNWDIYPANVKCYKYDSKGRVVTMTVNGSGTMGDWNYKYDQQDRIVGVERLGSIYSLKYDSLHGLLTELTVKEKSIKQRLEIKYR
jgi:hypothetical protein